MKKYTLIWKGGILLLFLVCLSQTWPLVNRSPQNAYRQACLSNLKSVALAFQHYAQDNSAFPPAFNSASGVDKTDNWVGIVSQGVAGKDIWRCPLDEAATDGQKTSYGYNANLAGKYEDANNIVLNFEVVADVNNRTQTGESFAAVTAGKRHLDGSNFLFADGHAKWFKLSRIPNATPNEKDLTFRVR